MTKRIESEFCQKCPSNKGVIEQSYGKFTFLLYSLSNSYMVIGNKVETSFKAIDGMTSKVVIWSNAQ